MDKKDYGLSSSEKDERKNIMMPLDPEMDS
jgi:hypothetical protein